MKAFVSYSLNDKDELVMAILSSKLGEKGFSINVSHDFYSYNLNAMTQLMISESSLFVGIITQNSIQTERVYREWNYAQQLNIPSILLVEKNMAYKMNRYVNIEGRYIEFDRENPNVAIGQIEALKSDLKNDETIKWIFGAAALVAVISLLSNKK